MIEVVNRQRRLKLDTEAWSNFAARALDAIGKSESSATIAFVSDKRIRELNRQFRDVDKATDVLSFPAEEKFNLGDVAVSVDTAAVQAAYFSGTSFEVNFICKIGYGAPADLMPRLPRLDLEEIVHRPAMRT